MDAFYAFVKSFWVVWLLVLFVGIVVWVYWPGRKKQLETHGEIPLRDDEPEK